MSSTLLASRRATGLVMALLASLACVACGNLPGDTLGTYAVKGTLTSNSCGAGIGAPNPWEFDVLLSQTGSTLFWSWEDGSPLLSGPLLGTHATLTAYEIDNVDTRDGGVMGPCDLERNDDLSLTMGAGSPPGSFTGSVSYTFSAQEGANCSDQLSSAGGMYDRLPCSVGYTVSATHQ